MSKAAEAKKRSRTSASARRRLSKLRIILLDTSVLSPLDAQAPTYHPFMSKETIAALQEAQLQAGPVNDDVEEAVGDAPAEAPEIEQHEAAKEEAKATERAANEEAFNKQADALSDARGDIVDKKNDSFDKQREATLEKSEELDDERGDYRQKSVDEIEETVFDTVREAVNELIELAEGFAQELIERAANALKELADEFGEFAKGLVDDLIGDIFPELAEAFADLVDASVDAFHSAVDAAADYASERVAAAAQGLRDGINAALDAFEAGINAAFELADTLLSMDFSDIVMLVLRTAVKAAGIDPDTFMEYIEKAKDNVRAIIDDPAGFLANLGAAFTGGVELFIGDFAASLRAGIVDWLTDAMSGVDIVIPERFDLMGVLDLARQVMGLTWDYLKEKIAGVIGQENLERLLWVKDQIRLFIDEGWSGLFEQVMDRLSGVRDDLFAQIRDFLVVRILTQVVTRSASLLSPVGAVIQLVLTVWDFIQAALEVLSRIWSVVTSVIDALDKIVNGILDPAKEAVKSTLDRLLPIAIGVLARFLRLGGLAARVQGFIEGLRARVDQAVDALIERVRGFFTGGEEDAEMTPEDEGTHEGFIADAILEMEEDPDEVVVFQIFREQKRIQANELQQTYDQNLEDPVRMTINFTEENEEEQVIGFEVIVAPNTTRASGNMSVPLWPSDILVAANSSFLSAAHSKARHPLEVGLEVLARATNDAQELDGWKQIDEATFKTAVQNHIQEGERGVNVPMLWEKPLLLVSYNTEFASHAEENLATGPLNTYLNREGTSEEKALDIAQYVRGQKANLHSNGGEFSRARDSIAGVVFNGALESSAAEIVVEELIQQLRNSDLVSPELKDAVTKDTVLLFLADLILGRDPHGITWSDFENYWDRTPDRDHIKNAFRNADSGNHEWVPLSELRDIIALGAEEQQIEMALQWLRFVHEVRTPTDQIVFLRTFEFSLQEFKEELAARDESNELLIDETLDAAHSEARGVESMSDLGHHVTHREAFVEFPNLRTHQEPLHDVLRGLFQETKHRNPQVFVNAVLGNMARLLWFPAKGWLHPGRTESTSRMETQWIEMERLAARQHRIIDRLVRDLLESASRTGITGISLPSALDDS